MTNTRKNIENCIFTERYLVQIILTHDREDYTR